MTRQAFALAVAAYVGGCRSSTREGFPSGLPQASASFAPVASAAPRRVFVLERVGEGCFVFSELSGDRTLGQAVVCPTGLEDGERIRLAGRACLRESAETTRNLPVRCPAVLVERAASNDEGALP